MKLRSRSLASAAVLALSSAHEAVSQSPNDPRFAMVTQAMDEQATAQDAQGLHDQAALTRKLAAQMRAGQFGSDPSAALGNAQQIEANAAAAREAKLSPTTPVNANHARPLSGRPGIANKGDGPRGGFLTGRLAVLHYGTSQKS